MKWQKKGLICNHNTFNLPWYKKNTMVPLPYLINEQLLRIYITMCDECNVGRIGYIDVDPLNPSKIIDFSQKPLLDIIDRSFFENGIITASLLSLDSKLYLYYSGYQLEQNHPYKIFPGVAISYDNGYTFINLTPDKPLLHAIDGETFMRSSPYVIQENGSFKVWYTSDTVNGWISNGKKELPLFNMKHFITNSPIVWPTASGSVAISLNDPEEHGIAKGTIWKENGLYKIIYSLRTLSKGYRLGYAESKNGITFNRLDNQVGIDVSEEGWDSDMIAFPERFQYRDKTYLFYSGNHYGLGGIGYAELISV